MAEFKYDLFISYSIQDLPIATELRKGFEEHGLACFMAEKDIPLASPWEEGIREAINLSKRVLLLITPRSKDRPWILLETGAAWALKKELIPALMFVSSNELIEPVRRCQACVIETSEQKMSFITQIASTGILHQAQITGRWQDKSDKDTVYFQQRGNLVVGIYDYGRKMKVAYYLGKLKGRTFQYEFHWYNREAEGHGQMTLFDDNEKLSGRWWYGDDKTRSVEHVGYDRIDNNMPEWLTDADFTELWSCFEDRNNTLK
jgi:hypothetical protein